jgi:hypothetical protein
MSLGCYKNKRYKTFGRELIHSDKFCIQIKENEKKRRVRKKLSEDLGAVPLILKGPKLNYIKNELEMRSGKQ